MKVEVLRAWPRSFSRVELDLPDGASVLEAVRAAGWQADVEIVACAVFGVAVEVDHPLKDGDRIELLRPLQADPKEARRSRARVQRGT
ncbi:MAG: RnfH family protein [Pseudomonadota bacterium]|nr:RnfH family protein [Pseudomonadota bacterium]